MASIPQCSLEIIVIKMCICFKNTANLVLLQRQKLDWKAIKEPGPISSIFSGLMANLSVTAAHKDFLC